MKRVLAAILLGILVLAGCGRDEPAPAPPTNAPRIAAISPITTAGGMPSLTVLPWRREVPEGNATGDSAPAIAIASATCSALKPRRRPAAAATP